MGIINFFINVRKLPIYRFNIWRNLVAIYTANSIFKVAIWGDFSTSRWWTQASRSLATLPDPEGLEILRVNLLVP